MHGVLSGVLSALRRVCFLYKAGHRSLSCTFIEIVLEASVFPAHHLSRPAIEHVFIFYTEVKLHGDRHS